MESFPVLPWSPSGKKWLPLWSLLFVLFVHPKGTKGMLSPARNRDALSTFLPLDRPQVIVAVTVVDLLCQAKEI